MKKFIVLLLFLAIITTGAFALEIGGGAQYSTITNSWNNTLNYGQLGVYANLGLGWFDFEVSWDFASWGQGQSIGLHNEFSYNFGLGAFFKIPIKITFVRISPAIGLTTNSDAIIALIEGTPGAYWYNIFRVKLGLGLDFFLGDKFYIHTAGLYLLDFADLFSKDSLDLAFRLGVGFRF